MLQWTIETIYIKKYLNTFFNSHFYRTGSLIVNFVISFEPNATSEISEVADAVLGFSNLTINGQTGTVTGIVIEDTPGMIVK